MKGKNLKAATPTAEAPRRVVLLGMPNTGKSTFFNRLTRASATVGNWPGMTVSLLQAQVEFYGELVEFVDLPGIYDLNGFSEDEAVVRQFLENFSIDLVVVVLNAAQIDRQIRLLLQAQGLNLPMIAALNMADEAKAYGVKISVDRLAKRLGLPILLVSAKYGLGCERACLSIAQALNNLRFTRRIENLNANLAAQSGLSEAQISALLAGTVNMPSQQQKTLTTRLDQVLLHPILGLPLFFTGMFLAFWLIWSVGLPAQDVTGVITDGLKTNLISPLMAPVPDFLQALMVDGLWNGVATVASFVPLIWLFFVLMAVLEDSGYLSRSAYLMDAFMERLGLDGRSFVLQMLGFGCNVPALMGTRVMRSHPLRLLTMLVIPFSLCSARLQVFVFILAALFHDQRGAIALFSLYLLSFLVALLTALIFQKTFQHDEPFVLELPPYRWPTLRQVMLRSWIEVREFVTRASGFILLGCATVWLVTNFPPGTTGLETVGGQMGQALSPVMQPLGINPQLTLALLFGFVAKEVVVGSLAVIYGLQSTGLSSALTSQLNWVEGYSFCIFCLLYTPCLATLATLLNESRSWKFMVFSLLFSLVLAWISSFIFYQGAMLLGFQ